MATLGAVTPLVRSFRAHPSSLYQVRQFVRAQSEAAELSEEVTDDLLLAVSEACVNAVLHSSSRTVKVSWRHAGACAEVVVQDEGVFRRRLPMPEIDGPSGRGILLMMAVMDEVTIQEGSTRSPGTQVRLRKCQPLD
jgi:anti-sigma regulatory factor (Ser/Thr protein kinase)